MNFNIPDKFYIFCINIECIENITDKMFLNNLNKDCVKWAEDLLINDILDTNCIRSLAGLTLPYNFSEVQKYFLESIDELKIEIPSQEYIVTTYSKYIIEEALNNRVTIAESIATLYELTKLEICFEKLYIFYKLHFAYQDLKDSAVQFYIEEATQENIESMILESYKKWLKEN